LNVDHIATHRKILNILNDPNGEGWVNIRDLHSITGIDTRTITAHLDTMVIDGAGAWLDRDKKYFSTKAGIAILAQRLGLRVVGAK
jgi:hypothetical protein